MAGGGGSSGVLGVLVGALIVVVVVGVGALYATGKLGGSNGPTVNIEAPKTTGSGGK